MSVDQFDELTLTIQEVFGSSQSGWNLTTFISLGTLLLLIYEVFINKRQKQKDLIVNIVAQERRTMQKDLVTHVTALLDIDRKTINKLNERQDFIKASTNTQIHQINIWINLNSENKYEEKLRKYCNTIAINLQKYYNGSIDGSIKGEEDIDYYRKHTESARIHISYTINEYFIEERKLLQELLEK